MNTVESDAFVFFGATGDLARKKIFPALYALVRRGGFNIPIVMLARGTWTLDKLRARARESIEESGELDGAAFEKLAALMRFAEFDYSDPDTYLNLKKALGLAKRPI